MGCLIDVLLKKSFLRLGGFVGESPTYFLIVPIFLTLICVTGFQGIKYEKDPEYLFSPINGQGKAERAIVEEYFKVNYSSDFDASRITRAGRFGRVIAITKDGDDNMLRQEVFEELRYLDALIQNATVEEDGEYFAYKDICAKWQDECFRNDILSFTGNFTTEEIYGKSLELNLNYNLIPIFLGGANIDDFMNGEFSAKAIQLAYFTSVETKKMERQGSEWEEKFLEVVGAAEHKMYFKHISLSYFASSTLDTEFEKNMERIKPYFSLTFLLMVMFCIITCMTFDSVRSKPWLGVSGILSVTMATLAAFGFCMYLGIEFIGINLASPFLMMGIGLDDTFVLLAAWRRTPLQWTVPERMSHTMSEAAVSITITTLTNVVSFCIGLACPFRSVQIFCIYSAMAVTFIYIWQLTFFTGCMALSGYRESKNKHAVILCKVQPLSEAIFEQRNFLYKIFIAGGIDHTDPNNPVDNKGHCIMNFFRDYVASFINNPFGKIFIIVVFIAYLVGAGFGVTQIKEGLERRKLSRDDSYSVRFYDREDAYYQEYPYRIQVVLTGDLDYSDSAVQQAIENFTLSLESTTYTSSNYTESWLRDFLSLKDFYVEEFNLTDAQSFNESLQLYLKDYPTFALDVKFDEKREKIVASRFLIQVVNVTDTNQEKVMVKHLRDICSKSSLDAIVFHPYFVFFDQFELILPTSIQAMGVGALIMMVILFLFIPSLMCSFWVAFSVVSIGLGVAGYMALWDVNLDSISMINLIMCIGFSVDFTSHICYAYMVSKKKGSNNKVKDALFSLGLPILQGATSTILSVVPLLLAEGYIFLVFFKMIFLVIFIGAMHGLFLLPVLLSLFGPGSCSSGDKDEYDVDNSYFSEDTLPVEIRSISQSTPYMCKNISQPIRAYGEDKDFGIGTSGEDSSVISSKVSPKRRETLENADNLRRFEEKEWRKTQAQDAFEMQRRRASFDMDREDLEYYSTFQRKRKKYQKHKYHRRQSSIDTRSIVSVYPSTLSRSQNNLYYPPAVVYNPYLSHSNLYYTGTQFYPGFHPTPRPAPECYGF